MKEDICPVCGFDKNLPRNPVITNTNVLALSEYLTNVCVGCGHQKDGSTIKKE